MSQRVISVSYKAIALATAMDVTAISELCFTILKRILSYYSSVIEAGSPVHLEIYRLISSLHSYFCTLGMIPMYDPRSRIQIQCITLLYEDPSRNVPVTFEGVTVFSTLLVHHPKMVLDFSVELIKEALAAIRLKTESSPSSEVFVDKIKSVCELISTSPSIAPLIASHQGRGNPYAIIRLGVASP
jgi:hypothetical protein